MVFLLPGQTRSWPLFPAALPVPDNIVVPHPQHDRVLQQRVNGCLIGVLDYRYADGDIATLRLLFGGGCDELFLIPHEQCKTRAELDMFIADHDHSPSFLTKTFNNRGPHL
jgi:hypothetical protein